MNLIYMCVSYQENYINLLKLLINSINVKANLNSETTHILIMTTPKFHELILKELINFNLPIKYYLLELNTLMEASCYKLKIFEYENIDKYNKILYLDTDVLINSDINILFNKEISDKKIYALEEGNIGHDYWGGENFFDFNIYNKNTIAFSAGVFLFINSIYIKDLFKDTNKHIINKKHIPSCLDQPYLVYNSVIQDKYDNQFMKDYLENNPSEINDKIIIYHFPGGPGCYSSKIDKMTKFWEKINNIDLHIFETRNEMFKYYCNNISNPKILEIGVFKGEFLDYIVKNCNNGFIEGVDLFEGTTCSGDVDGNNVEYHNIKNIYLELLDKYKDTLNVKLYKSNSNDFLQNIDDNIYDIIYIDGDHSYEGVKQDLINSYKKIKNNGYIMGHDYEMNMKKAKNFYDFGVKKAVDEFCIDYNLSILAKALDGCVSFCIKVIKN